MTAVFVDSAMDDRQRREHLFAGDVFVYGAGEAGGALADHTRRTVEEAFGGLDPRTAQHVMPRDDYAALLGELKPHFIHHPVSRDLLRAVVTEHGCDPDEVYFDVPRLRTATSHDYLTSGLAYAYHPHRDTWYSAPMMQLNWWVPVYEVEPRNAMALHPRYFARPVRNGSADYNYYEWNRTGRREAAAHVSSDTRSQPRPTQPVELEPMLTVLPPVGGLVLFSGAHLHSSVPNDSGVTRFSVDFRTVHLDDVRAHRGAPNVDAACTGTTLRDFRRVSDLAVLSEDLVVEYDSGPPVDARHLVYRP